MRAVYPNASSTRRAQAQVRFRGEADMTRQARLVGSVEMTRSGSGVCIAAVETMVDFCGVRVDYNSGTTTWAGSPR